MFSIEVTFCKWSIQYLTFFCHDKFHDSEVAYATIGNPIGDLQNFGDVVSKKSSIGQSELEK